MSERTMDATTEHAATGETPMSGAPDKVNLLAVAAYAERFAEPAFTPGEWVHPEPREDGVTILGWWDASEAVLAWEQALYDRHIIDPDSDYLGKPSVALVKRALADPSLVDGMDLPMLRRVLTFIVRGERHAGGGWYERAFASGMAQATTRRLGELAE